MVRYASGSFQPDQPNRNNNDSSYSSSSPSPLKMNNLISQLEKVKLDAQHLAEDNQNQADNINFLRQQAREHKAKISNLELKNQELQKELNTVRVLKNRVDDDNDTQYQHIQELEAKVTTLQHSARWQDSYLASIGQDVRVRFVENWLKKTHNKGSSSGSHQRSTSGSSSGSGGGGSLSEQRIQAGTRAIKRGQPVADAVLCLAGKTNLEHYYELYGVTAEDMAPRDPDGRYRGRGWSEVAEMVEAVGYRASLMAEGRPTKKFNEEFEVLIGEAESSERLEMLRVRVVQGIMERVRKRYREAMGEPETSGSGNGGRKGEWKRDSRGESKRDSKGESKRNSRGEDNKRNSGTKEGKRNSGPKVGW